MEEHATKYANLHSYRKKLVDPDRVFLHLKNDNEENKYSESKMDGKVLDTAADDESSGNYGIEFKYPGI